MICDFIVPIMSLRSAILLNKAIEERPFPSAVGKNEFIDEELVSVIDFFDGHIFVEPIYFNKGINGATKECLMRLSAAKRLEKAYTLLPHGLTFKVFDAWRPIEVQQALYNGFCDEIRKLNPHYTPDDVARDAVNFVSLPSYDATKPSVHNTGGAIDLTICNAADGTELDMGTAFDAFTEMAHTAYFEKQNRSREVRDNRRLLYGCMTSAGFTNLPSEWWHYDFGDIFWSFYTGKPTIYKGILKGSQK